MTPPLTIAIPTYNASTHFDKLITQLKSIPPLNKAFFIIDSSSTDQTHAIIKKHQLPHLTIPKSQFSHSTTRNLFLKHIKTPFVYFCTQDILPATSQLLSSLLDSLHHNPQAVAAFGPQLAYPKTPLFFKVETELMFNQLNQLNHHQPLFQHQSNLPKNNPFLWYFLSNNNSLYRTDFLRQHPFPKVSYGEDLAIGQYIIEQGFIKIYHPQAAVFHSHTYSLKEYAHRQHQDFQLYSQISTYRRPTFFLKTKTILSSPTSPKHKLQALNFMLATYLIKTAFFIRTKLSKL